MAYPNKAYEFGPFRLDGRERRLTRDGFSVPLRGRVFDTLYVLVSRHGRLVTKDELMAIIWPDSVVEETNLNHNICVLRRALGEKVTGQKYVETVPKQGYRFVADVKELDEFESSGHLPSWHVPEGTPTDDQSQADSALSHGELQLRAGSLSAAGNPNSRASWYRHPAVIPMLAVAVLLIIGFLRVEHLPFVDEPSNSRIMVAVLPFENLTGDSGQLYVADGLSHEIVGQLGRWNTERLGVIANTSSKVYQNAQKTIGEIGQELKVEYVVEGSLRRNEKTYRITVLLIRVEDQAHLWADTYIREAGSITALQDEVARSVISEICGRINVEANEESPSGPVVKIRRPNR